MEYSTFKQLKEAAELIKQQQKLEEEKRKQKEEQEKQEAFFQHITQFLQPQDPEMKQRKQTPQRQISPNPTQRPSQMENLVTIDMLNRQKEDIISTITQTIRENQTNFHSFTEKNINKLPQSRKE